MTKGDLVAAKFMKHLGPGLIEAITANNRILVSFEIDGQAYEDVFDAMELEIAKPTLTRI